MSAKVLLNAAITTSAAAYTAGDSIGGLILQKPGTRVNNGLIQDVKVLDTANQAGGFYLVFFNANPADSTITDNAAFVLHANDSGKVCGLIGVLSTDYVTINSKKWADVATQVDVNWFAPGTGDGPSPILYMAIVSIDAPSYGANATSLYITLGLGEAGQS